MTGKSSAWWRGFCVAVLWQLLIEDALGKAQYIKVTEDLWMDTKWWYWAIGILFFLAIPYFENWLEAKKRSYL